MRLKIDSGEILIFLTFLGSVLMLSVYKSFGQSLFYASGTLFCIYFILKHRIIKPIFSHALLWYAPILFTLFSGALSLVEGNSLQPFFSRLVNVLFILALSTCVFSYGRTDLTKLLKRYQSAIGVVLVTLPLGYFSSLMDFSIWDTRNNFHSSSLGITGNRETGIFREPSFAVVMLLDFMLIHLVLKQQEVKKDPSIRFWIIGAAATLLIASFAGLLHYLTMLIVTITSKSRLTIKALLLWAISPIAILFTYYTFAERFMYFSERIANVEQSSRFINIQERFQLIGSNLFLGNGASTPVTYQGVNSEYLHPSSNNLVADLFWEGGLVSLVLLTVSFLLPGLYVLIGSISSNARIVWIIVTTFFISEMYRGDYVTFRYLFFGLLIYSLAFFSAGKSQKNEKRSQLL